MYGILENELQVGKRLQKVRDDERISLKFVPCEDKTMTVEYLDWVNVTDYVYDTPRLTA